MDVIPKADLKDGHYYLNRNSGRGMRIGMWDKDIQKFRCWKAEFHWTVYEMEHAEDDRGFTIFEPIIDITEAYRHVLPQKDPPIQKEKST